MSKQRLMHRTRMELSEVRSIFQSVIPGTGGDTNLRFQLHEEAVISETLRVYYQDLGTRAITVLEEGVDYDFSPDSGLLTLASAVPDSQRLIAEGEKYAYFTDEQLEVFVEDAFEMHTRNRNPAVSYESLPGVEHYLVALLAKVEALWVLKTSAAFDINIHAPEGMFVPRGQRFEQLNVLIRETEERYKELSNALGVGLFAVEMFTLRRVSRQTGRYVPVYVDREFDDTRPPQRVFPNIGTQGTQLPRPTVATKDLHIYQGRRFEVRLDIEDGIDLASSNFEARLMWGPYRTSPTSREVFPQFDTRVDAPERQVVVSLTAKETAKLESTGSYVWDLRWTESEDAGTGPILQGKVLVESGFPLKNTNITVSS